MIPKAITSMPHHFIKLFTAAGFAAGNRGPSCCRDPEVGRCRTEAVGDGLDPSQVRFGQIA